MSSEKVVRREVLQDEDTFEDENVEDFDDDDDVFVHQLPSNETIEPDDDQR